MGFIWIKKKLFLPTEVSLNQLPFCFLYGFYSNPSIIHCVYFSLFSLVKSKIYYRIVLIIIIICTQRKLNFQSSHFMMESEHVDTHIRTDTYRKI